MSNFLGNMGAVTQFFIILGGHDTVSKTLFTSLSPFRVNAEQFDRKVKIGVKIVKMKELRA